MTSAAAAPNKEDATDGWFGKAQSSVTPHLKFVGKSYVNVDSRFICRRIIAKPLMR